MKQACGLTDADRNYPALNVKDYWLLGYRSEKTSLLQKRVVEATD